jgi:hypothetical protein
MRLDPQANLVQQDQVIVPVHGKIIEELMSFRVIRNLKGYAFIVEELNRFWMRSLKYPKLVSTSTTQSIVERTKSWCAISRISARESIQTVI